MDLGSLDLVLTNLCASHESVTTDVLFTTVIQVLDTRLDGMLYL
jgi:hypothetical protein